MKYLEKHLKLLNLIFFKYGIKKAAVFGSFAKNEMNSESDIDILIEPGVNFTIFKMLQLEHEIQELIKRKIDLVEYSSLKKSINTEVINSPVIIYEQV